MSKYSLFLNVRHGIHIKVCLRTLYKIQIYIVINGKTIVPKVLHNIVNLIGIILGKIIHNSLNGRSSQTNGNHPKGTSGLHNQCRGPQQLHNNVGYPPLPPRKNLSALISPTSSSKPQKKAQLPTQPHPNPNNQ